MSSSKVFEESYKSLNKAQRSAVDHIEGPVLVVAGPGTGKTQLLSMRVANIIKKTDTDSSNILCLTFTNKAAVNMRERLMQLTGGQARGVMVKTFHSFAAELMNMYPDFFWNGAKLSTAPDATQLEIIQDILSSLPLDDPLALRFAGLFTAGKDVKNALKNTKEAGLTPDKLKALIQANLAFIDQIEPQLVEILSSTLSAKKLIDLQQKVHDLPEQGIGTSLLPLQDLGITIKQSFDFAMSLDEGTNKTKNVGKWKQRWVQGVEGIKGMHKERERNLWWLSLANVYSLYRDELHARGYYDYSDMIVEVIAQLQKQASMRADAQEKFQYVLIDEFQDTNAAQLQLANLIADHPSANGNPNLMAVGDDDQSIYKFNGAELNNMLSFTSSYPKTKLIVLTENYRSSQNILNASSVIIEQIEDRLVTRMPDLTKDLIAKNEPEQDGTIEHRSYATPEHELSSTAQTIIELYGQSSEKHPGNSHDIAVLARGHADLRRMASLLTSSGIPVRYEKQNNILESPIVILIHHIGSALIALQNGDIQKLNLLLSSILRAEMWQISPQTLWSLAIDAKKTKSWLDSMLASEDTELRAISKWLMQLSITSSQQPLSIVIEYIIGLKAGDTLTSPLRQFYLTRKSAEDKIDTTYMESLSAIRRLLALADEFSRTSSAKLEDFVRFIQLSIDNEEIIADESIFVSGDNAVELLTVHKSKGLEFDTVFVLNATDNAWSPNTAGRKSPANLPLQPAGDEYDDYARLMYVAATRSKRTLIVSSHREDINGKEVLSTPIIHEALARHDHEAKEQDSVKVIEENLRWPRLSHDDEKLNLESQLENFSISASSLLNFLDLTQGGPSNFLERNLLRLPQEKSTSLLFGTTIHSALEYAQIAVNSDSLDETSLLKYYEDTLKSQPLSDTEFNRYNDHGKDLLKKLLASDTFWIGKGGIPEQSINDIKIGDAILGGSLDRINVQDGELTIIDYKTGKPLSSFTTKNQSLAVKAWRHKTQLIFYALLIENSPRFNPSLVKGQMWYLEASLSKELIREYIPTQEEIDRTRKLVQAVYKKVKALDLPDTSNYSSDYSGILKFEQDLIDEFDQSSS